LQESERWRLDVRLRGSEKRAWELLRRFLLGAQDRCGSEAWGFALSQLRVGLKGWAARSPTGSDGESADSRQGLVGLSSSPFFGGDDEDQSMAEPQGRG
jgi:hypothetical protein